MIFVFVFRSDHGEFAKNMTKTWKKKKSIRVNKAIIYDFIAEIALHVIITVIVQIMHTRKYTQLYLHYDIKPVHVSALESWVYTHYTHTHNYLFSYFQIKFERHTFTSDWTFDGFKNKTFDGLIAFTHET